MQLFPDPKTADGAAQLAVASTILDQFQNVYALSYNGTIGGISNAFAESSLRALVPGDADAAGGLWQLHKLLHDIVLKGCGVDMWTATVEQQCHGMMWLLTQPGNGYLGYAAINGAATPEDGAEIWCRKIERPRNVEIDVVMRRTYATQFAAYYPRGTAWRSIR